MDRENVIKGLESCIIRYPDDKPRCDDCPYESMCCNRLKIDALALLKEQEEQKQKWLQNIADNQLANSPDEWQSPEQRMYSKGVFDGLQIAYEMLAYGVVTDDA